MSRADLLALSPDDLAALTNRGTVKRVQRDLEDANLTCQLMEAEDGTVTARWSDGVECVLPGSAVASAGRCSCVATEVCRHIVRSVLFYQKQSATVAPPDPAAPWNPGDVTDEELGRHFKPAALTLAREQFRKGLLVELIAGAKPTIRFHDLAYTLRFQVPGDVRYSHCDCVGAAPCPHVPLAVWAFRKMPPGQSAAVLTTQEHRWLAPTALLDAVEETLLAGLEFGLAGAASAWRDRMARLENECRTAALIWPAELLVDVIHQYEAYTAHDARFSPDRLAELVGELLIRCDAIRNNTDAVPQPLIRGTASDHRAELGAARFIGVGCGVQLGRRRATLTAFLQDADSGSMVAVRREFPDPPPGAAEATRDFWELAQTPALKGRSFAELGAGQLVTQGGKRSADHEIVLGRARAAVNAQNFSWESLRPPVLVENFGEVRARLAVLPPSSLRPRRVAENFHVCPVAGVEAMVFEPGSQSVLAKLVDARGDRALLLHPYTHRGREGAERLLTELTARGDQLRFVAGPLRLAAEGLVVAPEALIFQDGSTRTMLQPWIDRWQDTQGQGIRRGADGGRPDPIEEIVRDLLAAVGELLATGFRRVEEHRLRSWQELRGRVEALCMSRLAPIVGRVTDGLLQRHAVIEWDWRPTARALLELAALVRLAEDLSK